MNRRKFLQSSAVVTAAQAFPWTIALAAEQGWRTFETVTRVEVSDPFGLARAWVPLPLTADYDWHRTLDNSWSGNASRAEVLRDAKYGLTMLYVEWPAKEMNPVIEVKSRFMTRDRQVDLSAPRGSLDLEGGERTFFTAPSELIPTDGLVRETALKITRGADTDVAKARAIYEWIVDNTFRDPKVKGCGVGDIKAMLETGNLGGKCADLNALFVGLARSVGVPARDIYGVRVAASNYGYKSLGIGSPSASKAQHCRAEFFARGYGWVPVDPADVRKVVLEEPPGNLPIDDAKVVAARKRLFGGWEMNYLAYNMGHDVHLPHAARATKLPYLMYTNAEADGELRDQMDPESLKYSITARELTA
ncbi:MAG TPA: transglutaminase domain-containing protein [Burkholderiales bacterium]|jgi:transglutaminase-like putative cysteine protease|nr:transglutaminase domain-containing protein [Burkholderiales bacterium]